MAWVDQDIYVSNAGGSLGNDGSDADHAYIWDSAAFRSATNATFNAFSVSGIGVEPKVSAAFSSLLMDQMSAPIKGNNGVYVLQLTNVVEPTDQLDYIAGKTRLTQTLTSRAGYQAFQALEKASEVIDNRDKFY